MFWSFWFVCLSVNRITYQVVNRFKYIKLLSEVHLEPRNNLIHFGDDPDYPVMGLVFKMHIKFIAAMQLGICCLEKLVKSLADASLNAIVGHIVQNYTCRPS